LYNVFELTIDTEQTGGWTDRRTGRSA